MKKYAGIIMISGMVAFASLIPAYAEGLEQNGEIAVLTENTSYVISINDKAVSLSKMPYDKDSHIMLPLREVAQALGFRVEWNNEDNSVSLDDDIVKTRVTIGEDSYYLASSKAIGMTAPMSFGIAPEIKDATAYVPLDLFKLLLGEDRVEVGENTISLYANAEIMDNDDVQMPNPFTEYDTISEAEKAVSFKPVYPSYLPSGYKADGVSTMEDNFLQIFYKNDDKEICYRMAIGSDDISGDYNVYDDVKQAQINDLTVTIRTNGETASAIWTKDNYTFSIFSNSDISMEEIVKIISSIK